jgi:uncharacterized sulfatase
MRQKQAVRKTRKTLLEALSDDSPSVRVIAAEALGRYGKDADAAKALDVLLELANIENNSAFVAMLAMNAIDAMDERAAPAKDRIAALPSKAKRSIPRAGGYVARLIEKTLADLE